VLVSTGSGYRLALAPDQLDVAVFGAQIDRARRLLGSGDAAGAIDAFDAAFALWRGPPMAEIAGPSADAERARLGELRLTAVEEWAAAMLDCGRLAPVVAELVALVAEHPLRERLRALLMRALYRSGRKAEALRVFADARQLLREELGIEPGPELRRLHQDVLSNRDVEAGGRVDPDRPPRAKVDQVVPRQLPPALPHFAGRVAELRLLTDLADQAAGTGGTVITAIDGTAGVGKTALALYWAHQVAYRFPDGQLYVNLRGYDPTRSPMRPEEALRGFLEAIGVARRVPVSVDAQAALYRSLLAGKRILVVLDNARDAEQVRPLLPGSSAALVVVTARKQLASLVAVEGAYPLSLHLLPVAEARDLLARRVGAGRVDAEPQAVNEIIASSARLPLALAIVAARAVVQRDLSLARLAAELHADPGGLDAFAGGDAASDMRAVLTWSYQRLSVEAARLFRLLGLHRGPDIAVPAAASLAGLSLGQVRPLLVELSRAHLVAEDAAGRYAFHDLLRAFAAELAHSQDSEGARRAAVHRVLDHYLHSAHGADMLLEPHRHRITPAPPCSGVSAEQPADAAGALAWFGAEHRVLLAAVELAVSAGFDTHAWQLAWTLTEFFDRRGHWHDLVVTMRAALAAARRLGDRPGQARAHRGLARAGHLLGRDEDARIHLYEALDLYTQLGDHTGQAHACHNLASVAERQRRHVAALHHAQRALDLFRVAGDRAGQARALNTLGWCRISLGDCQRALTYCREALAILQKLGDPTGQACTWDSLGSAHHHLGQHREAITCYRHALDLFREVGNRYYESQALTHLGDTHHAAGDLDAAFDTWRQALDVLDQLGHSDAVEVRVRLDALKGLADKVNGRRS